MTDLSQASKGALVLVDDDDMLRQVLSDNLIQAGYDILSFSDGEQAYAALTTNTLPIDLFILDWSMPGGSGLDLLKRLRANGFHQPALFFTSHNQILYEEAALACGAVDFIDKTRSFSILARRIEMCLQRPVPAVKLPPDVFVLGDLRLDAANHTVSWKSTTVELTFGEFRIVDLLARSSRDMGYREIYDTLRGEDFVAGEGPDGYRANVRALIKRIRQKFLRVDPEFDAIGNYPGFGYRWGKDHA